MSAFPDLGGSWRARFELDQAHQRQLIRLSVSLSLAGGVVEGAVRLIEPAELVLDGWVPLLRQQLLDCVREVYERLEAELVASTQSAAVRTLTCQPSFARLATSPLTLLGTCRRRLVRQGSAALASLDPQRGVVNLLAEIEADARAELLLAAYLGPDYELVRRRGYLDIPSRLFPRRLYRVRRGQRIQILEDGRCSGELCLEASLRVPDADEFLMKIIWLTANEEYVLRTANHFPPARLLV